MKGIMQFKTVGGIVTGKAVSCTQDEFNEYLERWQKCHDFTGIYISELINKGIEAYPYFRR